MNVDERVDDQMKVDERVDDQMNVDQVSGSTKGCRRNEVDAMSVDQMKGSPTLPCNRHSSLRKKESAFQHKTHYTTV